MYVDTDAAECTYMHVARNAVEATRRNVHAFLHFFPLYGSLQHIAVEILCFVYYCYILLVVFGFALGRRVEQRRSNLPSRVRAKRHNGERFAALFPFNLSHHGILARHTLWLAPPCWLSSSRTRPGDAAIAFASRSHWGMGCDIWDRARDQTGRARTLGGRHVLYRRARDLRNHVVTWLQ
jgi:hypothetical protein